MLKIHYPPHNYRIKQEDNKEYIFDEVRKKWVRLTPEEWVRQNFVQYLLQVQLYPASLIGIEKELLLNDIKKRCDILIYKNNEPLMLVECKEMHVDLSEAVLKQVLMYNMAMPVNYLCVTNGSYCYAWQKDGNGLIALKHFPHWQVV
ncbi:type I restriction enzyme HsdR N-terminal domain-containing protein [Foetidibacter luteolus]|uniref:type I restriction enzyme HsdR N-terminal domain-containing protein n=1 Tax=Foetidibacter luteolus TaxID=2608880 RepID=UPI00129BECBF|nr:type I restriction enzyme HsdR N-terminal domain-containing protein [Foetidibacter luteolus]